jgi:ATP-dependent DNA helicase RecG
MLHDDATKKKLEKLGITDETSLLRHFPARYEDLGALKPISEISHGEQATIVGVVRSFDSKRSWKRRLLISESVVEDATGYVRVIFFGQRFLEKTFIEGRTVRLSGKVEIKDGEKTMTSPAFESASRIPTHTGRIIGIYSETYGITSKWLRWQIQEALQNKKECEYLPIDILKRYRLPEINKALYDIHFPKTLAHAEVAKKRFAFEEMFLLQLRFLRANREWKTAKSPAISEPKSFETLRSILPFTLTDDQEKATQEILHDLAKNHPMNRLLNGDVGSGKTAVAILAALHTAYAKFQTALLAPTEVLASQHFRTATTLLANSNVSIALFTRSYRVIFHASVGETQEVKRDEMLRAIKSGTISLIIGTHALLVPDVRFHALALAIVDEQHRFGVKQRAHLQKYFSHEDADPLTPHLLTMTATPIPRTLSLALFGNLDISLLETMPKGRKEIETTIVPPEKREEVYAFIRQEIALGRQVYVILPLVEESDAFEGTKAAVAEHERLQKNVFPNLTVGLVHGKMKAREKEAAMRDFHNGTTHILVATAVVEVGVDVPNATIMLIEEAQRFGLSQLHQFRGRIGRGEHQSYCFLFAGNDTETPTKRMRILETNAGGFDIANEDLKLRGAGEFLGTRQSGIPDIGMENLMNVKLISFARKEAQTLLDTDPKLEHHPELSQKLNEFDRNIHLE